MTGPVTGRAVTPLHQTLAPVYVGPNRTQGGREVRYCYTSYHQTALGLLRVVVRHDSEGTVDLWAAAGWTSFLRIENHLHIRPPSLTVAAPGVDDADTTEVLARAAAYEADVLDLVARILPPAPCPVP